MHSAKDARQVPATDRKRFLLSTPLALIALYFLFRTVYVIVNLLTGINDFEGFWIMFIPANLQLALTAYAADGLLRRYLPFRRVLLVEMGLVVLAGGLYWLVRFWETQPLLYWFFFAGW